MLNFKKRLLLSCLCVFVSCCLAMVYLFNVDDDEIKTQVNVGSNLAASNNQEETQEQVKAEEVDIKESEIYDDTTNNDNNDSNNNDDALTTDSEDKNEDNVVYDGLTLDELASKLNRSFKNELSNKGYLYASYSLEKNVDPYLAAAISLEETGCNYNCSNLIKTCNNVGGMKGSGCGSYGYFNTLDDGIRAFIDNISRNYVAYGLTTADTMNPKYAENPAWANNVNNYITRIRNS